VATRTEQVVSPMQPNAAAHADGAAMPATWPSRSRCAARPVAGDAVARSGGAPSMEATISFGAAVAARWGEAGVASCWEERGVRIKGRRLFVLLLLLVHPYCPCCSCALELVLAGCLDASALLVRDDGVVCQRRGCARGRRSRTAPAIKASRWAARAWRRGCG
jgi:hypothetical protein